MNDEEIKKLRSKIQEFESQDIFVKIENALQYYTTIYNAKIIISSQKLILSDEQQQDFIIELMYLEQVIINGNSIILEMSNDLRITLDY